MEAEEDSVEVYINGEFVGMTPAKLNLVEGTHFVELRAGDGGRRYRREIRIMDGAEANLYPVWNDHENGEVKSPRHAANVEIA